MTEEPISVLLDTNVFVAAYWAPHSASARLIEACAGGRLRAHYSVQVKDEVLHILRTIRVRDSYLRQLDPFWERAVQVRPEPIEGIHIDDLDDRKFLEAALGGGTDFLVTNDDHLLRVGFVGRTEILTPGSMVRIAGL